MFATNNKETFDNDYVNIRNSNNWDKIITRTKLENPVNNGDNNQWTEWLATNTFTGQTEDGEPKFNAYKYYVIEIYSTDDQVESASDRVGFSAMKMLFSEDSSIIYYNDNCKFELNFPTENSPGPDGIEGHTTIGKNLINTERLPLYQYSTTINGITAENGYKDNNVLAYQAISDENNTETDFMINVLSANNSLYEVTIKGDPTLTGTIEINPESAVSLDTKLVYEENLALDQLHRGVNYSNNDLIAIDSIFDAGGQSIVDSSNAELLIKVDTIDGQGAVTRAFPVLTEGYDKTYEIGKVFIGKFTTTNLSNPEATGFIADFSATCCSGECPEITIEDGGLDYAVGDKVAVYTNLATYQGTVCNVSTEAEHVGEVLAIKLEHTENAINNTSGTGLRINAPHTAGNGATLKIETKDNLGISAAFTGNKMDLSAVALFDQPIIKEYNHFTTYLEFEQPEIKQQSIVVNVSLAKNTSTTSGIILQNVKNALYNLFNLKPDSIGKGLKLSTIYTTIMSVKDVEWCKVLLPVGNVDTAINELLVPATIKIIDVTEA